MRLQNVVCTKFMNMLCTKSKYIQLLCTKGTSINVLCTKSKSTHVFCNEIISSELVSAYNHFIQIVHVIKWSSSLSL